MPSLPKICPNFGNRYQRKNFYDNEIGKICGRSERGTLNEAVRNKYNIVLTILRRTRPYLIHKTRRKAIVFPPAVLLVDEYQAALKRH